MNAPEFCNDNTVIGKKLFELVEWAKESRLLGLNSVASTDTPLVLPPFQRSSVWNAKQIIDLWDSVLRGMPIGIFYLLTRTKVAEFELLDGQQRLRALLLGFAEKTPDERCLWVDLAPADSSAFKLFITSKTQPFGYDPATGRKWPTYDRRLARELIEPEPNEHPILVLGKDGKPRSAYDSELFAGNIAPDGKKIEQPPKPYKSSDFTFRLNYLLEAWGDGCLEALAKAAPGASAKSINALHLAFNRLKATQVALLKVDISSLDGDGPELALFERVGAGGTRLSDEERLYSIYKYHKPEIRCLVEKICANVGKVLPPTKIVTTALRIANTRKKQAAFSVPDVALFAKEMKNQESELRSKLDELLVSGDQLQRGFTAIKNIICNPERSDSNETVEPAGTFWIPDVLLATLPPGLWQVLVFWACSAPSETKWNESREEVVRFALFWRLCVWNDEKATVRCFGYLFDKRNDQEKWENVFPAIELYHVLIGHEGDKYAQELISFEDFDQHFVALSNTPIWRNDAGRFGTGDDRVEMCARWWWKGKELLPWLQRDYIRDAFQEYTPLTDHEDDIPYDLDHICPRNDWRDYWTNFESRLVDVDKVSVQKLRDNRDQIGEGIGNLRLVGSAENRGDGDADIAEKMRFINEEPESCIFKKGMKDWAFSNEIAPWRDVSRSGAVAERKWNNERLQAFQEAVEKRAVYLYRRFYEDLKYSYWLQPEVKTKNAVNELAPG